MDANGDRFYTLLRQLVESLAQVNALLKDDESLFKKNDTATLSAHNEKKQLLISHMTEQAAQLQSCLPLSNQGKPISFQRYAEQLEPNTASKVNALFESLQAKLAEGYEHLIHNNQVVISNLSFLKELWDKLSSQSQANNGVYENPSKSSK